MERWIRRWGALILLNAAFLGIGLSWLFLIPYNNAPDENTHFAYSVEFIRTQRRLPVWGVDDAERFRFALSSYNQMPALNYVAAAAAAQAGGRLGLEPWQGARLASLAWGLVFLNGLFLAVRALAGRTAPAALVTGALAFIPQVLFTFCYVNADAHSLAIAALLAWAGARLIRRPGALTLVLFGLAGGLLFSAKYNYFIYVPLLAAGFGWLAWRRVVPWRRVWQAAGAAALGAVLISGFWYARNLRLYGSPLPLLLSQARLAAMGVIPDLVPTDRGLSLASLAWMMNEGFGATTFASFFGLFGYLDVAWPPAVYAALRIVIPALFAGLLIELLRTRDRPACLAALWTLGALLAILALHVWACLRYDYQPQGRYYFTGLAPLAAPSAPGRLAGRAPPPVCEIPRGAPGRDRRPGGPDPGPVHPDLRAAADVRPVLGRAGRGRRGH